MATLKLFVCPGGPSIPLDGRWLIQSAHNSEGLERGYADPGFDDSGWEPVTLPHLRHATAEQDTLWYRYHIDLSGSLMRDLTGLARILLRFGGAFYYTRVWLNGFELGTHEGYFQPFGFDVTDILKPSANVLAVQCRFPVEAGSFKRKTAVAGIFTDWDCKPYPSALYPNLPEPAQWTVPIGLWQAASLHTVGPVIVESLTVLPDVRGADWARGAADSAEVRVKAVLRNLTPNSQDVSTSIQASKQARVQKNRRRGGSQTRSCGNADAVVRKQFIETLSSNERREVETSLTLPNPRLWFPWTHGEPCMYELILTAEAQRAAPLRDEYVQPFAVRDIQAEIAPGRWEWRLNGRRIFPRGSNYVSDFYLDRVTADGLRRDLELARNANLDLLRVHAHIAPLDFYRLCDEMGLMVMCDFPLIWTYGFNLSPDEDAAFRANVHAQVDDMIRLLGSHPGIVLWSMHNEPPWTPDGSFLGRDVHESATNRQMDEDSARRARALDPTRPAIPASGIYDQHLYHGWYTGTWIENRELRPSFPTEFGVQALPNLDSPFWATVNSNWPVEADDPGWAHSGYQAIFWASPGVGPPAHYKSLADYVAESQAYQAFYIRYTIDQWRRQKFNPVGGYIHFLFTDGWPAITWSVLDYFRLPKAGYAALRQASAPIRLCLDLREGFKVEHGFRLVYAEGDRLKIDLWLVNDDYGSAGEIEVEYRLDDRGGELWSRLRRALRWGRGQRFTARLPGAGEPAAHVAAVEIPLRRPGQFTFQTRLRLRGRTIDTNAVDFRVGEVRERARHPRRVPGLFADRVYVRGSLRHTEDGFTFTLKNPAMPVRLERLNEMRVDGAQVEPAQVEVVRGGESRRASSISPQAPLEIPSGEKFAVVVRGWRLRAGPHELELTAEFLGLGEITARLKDRLI